MSTQAKKYRVTSPGPDDPQIPPSDPIFKFIRAKALEYKQLKDAGLLPQVRRSRLLRDEQNA